MACVTQVVLIGMGKFAGGLSGDRNLGECPGIRVQDTRGTMHGRHVWNVAFKC